ncbi:MAG: phosphate ABC transporter substrate-binding protein PstS [Acetobacteraceae bacterium]
MQIGTGKSLRRRAILLGSVGAGAAGIIGLDSRSARAAGISLLETGSTMLYPLFNLWVAEYTRLNPGVRITTQGTGSGTGIAQAISGIAEIGTSDAYMSNAQARRNPDILNIPLAISAQTVNYNLPGFNDTHLRLSGPVLAGIYSGKITHWNDPAIGAINPAAQLPARAITPMHRTDGSGDTFIFTQYLAFSTPVWANGVGFGTSISWPPIKGGIGAIGNPGMVQTSGQTRYSVAYIGVSFHDEIAKAGLGTAVLRNRAGNFVLPTSKTVGAAAAAVAERTPPDQRVSLVFGPGPNSYPIVNYEYAIVSRQQPSAKVAATLRNFLTWAVDPKGGAAARFLDAVRFLPLPQKIAAQSMRQITEIGA